MRVATKCRFGTVNREFFGKIEEELILSNCAWKFYGNLSMMTNSNFFAENQIEFNEKLRKNKQK